MNGINKQFPDEWETKKKILVILAHPDDPEFFCGASLIRWARAGHEIHYVLLTNGNKGGNDDLQPEQLRSIRQKEQLQAAAIIGVRHVQFLDHEDGFLMSTLEIRREIVRIIRQEKPDILVTCDPTLLYNWFGRINHPDHRAAGQVVLDAVYPAAGNSHYFPELQEKEGLQPHTPSEVWISLPLVATTVLDVTDTWDIKIKALKEHQSQIGDPELFEQKMRSRYTENSSSDAPHYEEKFRVLKLI
jgi:LmbE family N-acetylglucosaminyl deacetylase